MTSDELLKPRTRSLEEIREEEDREYEIKRDGWRFLGYCNPENGCPNCGRDRVGLYKNGKRVCEKCCWDMDRNTYDSDAHNWI